MHIKTRQIKDNITTPLLLPSFSSKGFPYINKILKATELYFDIPFLISAYDLYYRHIELPQHSSNLLFIDSGGYECSNFRDISDINNYNVIYKEWDIEKHTRTINEIIKQNKSIVIISYDNYNENLNIIEQVKRAELQFKQYPTVVKEFLLKPEPSKNHIDVDLVLLNINQFKHFDIIGVTEKELGLTVKERMINLYKIRRGLIEADIDRPIHIFGCLDTITIPLYFLCGADIFDGLCWLRYAFYNDATIYKSLAFLLEENIEIDDLQQDIYNQVNNYTYLKNLQNNLLKYIETKNIVYLGKYGTLIIDIYNKAMMEV